MTRRRGSYRRFLTVLLTGSLIVTLLVLARPASALSLRTQIVVSGLGYPSMFTFAPDGRIFFSELSSGRIRVYNPATKALSTYFQVTNRCDTGGLFGVAVHPQFSKIRSVYAYTTRKRAGGGCDNQVLKIDGTSSRGTSFRVLLSDPYVAGHIGGRLLFGPDRNLYVSTGDGASASTTRAQSRTRRAAVQDLASFKGKILRLTHDGQVPAANPHGNFVFARGFRNVFGFDFDLETKRLWVIDNGPDGSDYQGAPRGPGPNGGCNDEINRVVAGANYGWGPNGSCATPPTAPQNSNRDGTRPLLPNLNIAAATGVTGGRFCHSCGLGAELEGHFFYVRYGSQNGMGEIHAAKLGADRNGIASNTMVFRAPGRTPLSIERSPNGALYYSDSRAIHRLVR